MPFTPHYGNMYYDFSDFNNEGISVQDSIGNYYFKREADTENFITIRRIRLYYRDLGAAVATFIIVGQNQDGTSNTITIANFAFGGVQLGAIVWCYTDDFEITITTPQLFINRVSGPISIVKIVLVGDSEQLPTI